MKLTRTTLVGLLALVITVGQALSAGHGHIVRGHGVPGSGDMTTVERDVEHFTRIEVNCAFDLEIVIAQEQNVTLTFDDNLIDLIETEVHGSTLTLDCQHDFDVDRSCRVEITVPELREVCSARAVKSPGPDYKVYRLVCSTGRPPP